MIKVCLMIVAVVFPDGTLEMSAADAGETCPTTQDVAAVFDPLVTSGDIKQWQYYCNEVYLSTKGDKET